VTTCVPPCPRRCCFAFFVFFFVFVCLFVFFRQGRLGTNAAHTHGLLQTDMPRLYKSVDAFVLPSRGEGWGRPHTEAMSMGLPVIGTHAQPSERAEQGPQAPLFVPCSDTQCVCMPLITSLPRCVS